MRAPASAKPQRGDMFIVTSRHVIQPSPVGAAWTATGRAVPPRWGLNRFFFDARTINMSLLRSLPAPPNRPALTRAGPLTPDM